MEIVGNAAPLLSGRRQRLRLLAKVQRLREKGLLVVDAENDQRWCVLKNLMGGVTVLVDALFGTGARVPISGNPGDLLKQVARFLQERGSPPAEVEASAGLRALEASVLSGSPVCSPLRLVSTGLGFRLAGGQAGDRSPFPAACGAELG